MTDNYQGTRLPDLGPVVDPSCEVSIIKETRQFNYDGRVVATLTAKCLECSGCVISYVGEIGDPEHLRGIAHAFCAIGQRQAN